MPGEFEAVVEDREVGEGSDEFNGNESEEEGGGGADGRNGDNWGEEGRQSASASASGTSHDTDSTDDTDGCPQETPVIEGGVALHISVIATPGRLGQSFYSSQLTFQGST